LQDIPGISLGADGTLRARAPGEILLAEIGRIHS